MAKTAKGRKANKRLATSEKELEAMRAFCIGMDLIGLAAETGCLERVTPELLARAVGKGHEKQP